jgi:hypothetical protein
MNEALQFPMGSVGYNVSLMIGVWHDHIELFEPDGAPRFDDAQGGKPGAAPYDNLVYIDFDGVNYRQTNVTLRGRPLHVRSFTATLRNGVLEFDKLGPNDPGHIGVAAGVGVLIFAPRVIDDSWQRYSEPDYIRIVAPNLRTRNTMLYRDGKLARTMNVTGYRLSPIAAQRMPFDPRGADGPVHEARSTTEVFRP